MTAKNISGLHQQTYLGLVQAAPVPQQSAQQGFSSVLLKTNPNDQNNLIIGNNKRGWQGGKKGRGTRWKKHLKNERKSRERRHYEIKEEDVGKRKWLTENKPEFGAKQRVGNPLDIFLPGLPNPLSSNYLLDGILRGHLHNKMQENAEDFKGLVPNADEMQNDPSSPRDWLRGLRPKGKNQKWHEPDIEADERRRIRDMKIPVQDRVSLEFRRPQSNPYAIYNTPPHYLASHTTSHFGWMLAMTRDGLLGLGVGLIAVGGVGLAAFGTVGAGATAFAGAGAAAESAPGWVPLTLRFAFGW